jgi:hypothetical protein
MDHAFHWDAQKPPHPEASRELWALFYASFGWAVLPLHSVDRGVCTCGDPNCRSAGKHPRTSHGVKGASTDPEQIRKWWRQWPDANVGIATGAVSGLVVIDIDPRNGGNASYTKLQEELPGTFDKPLKVRSGSDGTHLYFGHPGGHVPCCANLRPGIDVKADGGYIVAPPSMHLSGGRYRFARDNGFILPELPTGLRDLLVPQAQAHDERGERPSIEVDSLHVSDEIKALIRQGPPHGDRSKILFKVLRALVGSGYDDETIQAVLLDPSNKLSEKPREKGEAWLRGEIKRAREKPDTKSSSRSRGAGPNPEVRCLADVEPENVDWLWHPYIPIGKLTSIEGDPGLGKSWLAFAIAAALSKGANLPGELSPREPRRVLLLTAEDGLGDTLRPRLDRLGADPELIFGVELSWELDEAGLKQLRDMVTAKKPAFVIIDPLVAFMGGKLDLHKANQVRAVMARLANLAQECTVAIVFIRHLSKGKREKAIYRGQGSIDITAACRSVLMVGLSPDGDTGKRIVAHTKHNLTPPGRSLSYIINEGKFEWTGEVDLTAEDLCREPENSETRSAREEAEEFLKEVLKDGPVPQTEVAQQAEEQGISKRTLDRAKKSLRIKSKRTEGRWVWSLSRENDA